MKNFAITGVAGYIAPRHLRAIRDTGNTLVAATDPHDSVGLLDQFSFDVRYFPEFERFDRHLEKLKRGPEDRRVHYLSVCTPNYLHDAHCRLGLRAGADVICEKPIVVNPWNLDALEELEHETGRRVFNVLQLRVHPALIEVKRKLDEAGGTKHDVDLTYITSRGRWYMTSWKGQEERSGGITTNIGVHLFDLLLWFFGPLVDLKVHHMSDTRAAGMLELERARVRWFLSVNQEDLPFTAQPGGRTTFRSIRVDGQEVEFTEGFADLHTRVYEEVLAGRGFGIPHARPAIEAVHRIRKAPLSPALSDAHEMVREGKVTV
ncbi:MAG: Gfo/Idh/MocA family oxidoreductase [Thermoanaerobaculia bacterium]